MDAQDILTELVGEQEDVARTIIELAGMRMRVVARDGTRYIVTTEYRGDRINVELVDDLVTRAMVG